jgi:large subunit ribosomal protein L25
MDVLHCEKRNDTGKRRNRRLRDSGLVPAVLYGRGENENLSIQKKDVYAAVRHGSQIVELRGDFNESALIKRVQWDGVGVGVLHLDLTRIDASETLKLTLPVELVGVAPGTKRGGVIRHLLHEVEVLCPASAVPEKLEIKINHLELNGEITAAAIPLPQGASLVTDPDDVVVSCDEPKAEVEAEVAEGAGPAEPEVIGRKREDDEEAADE